MFVLLVSQQTKLKNIFDVKRIYVIYIFIYKDEKSCKVFKKSYSLDQLPKNFVERVDWWGRLGDRLA